MKAKLLILIGSIVLITGCYPAYYYPYYPRGGCAGPTCNYYSQCGLNSCTDNTVTYVKYYYSCPGPYACY